MEHKAADIRQCEIEGPAFDGVAQSLESQKPAQPKVTKILMVHGISTHHPGYSARFQKKLYETLGLNKTDATIKTIDLDSPALHWGDEPHVLGQLRITRHRDEAETKELLFYELTWSPITEEQKKVLSCDSANSDGLRRSDVNGALKSFMNATVPDMLIYNGNGYDRITKSVEESVCWMMGSRWADLPASGRHMCGLSKGTTFDRIAQDDHFFVTHSLGSRITIDTIQSVAVRQSQQHKAPRDAVLDKIRDKSFTVFMMANQLPLLQMGREPLDNKAGIDAYCQPGGVYAAQRVMKKMNIIAFSDPNDILSYPVPASFSQRYFDNRICPSIVNVSLNIATPQDVLGAFSFANPAQAHSGYIDDERVIDMIAHGIRKAEGPTAALSRCKWVEVKPLFERAGM